MRTPVWTRSTTTLERCCCELTLVPRYHSTNSDASALRGCAARGLERVRQKVEGLCHVSGPAERGWPAPNKRRR